MTGKTICNIFQSFPALLIVAQNYNKCTEVPFDYKPPCPSHYPEYSDGLDSHYPSLYGHGYHGHDTYHDYGNGHGTYSTKYPVYGSPHHTYPQMSTTNHGYPSYYNFKKQSNGSGYRGHKTYAPNQVYNVRNKFKVVVKKNRFGLKNVSQKLQEDICTTIDQNIGSCIPLPQCSVYMRMVQDPRNKQNAFNILRKSHCGFEGNNPKVCCPRSDKQPQQQGPRNTHRKTPTHAPAPPSRKTVNEDYVPTLPEPPVCGALNATFDRVFAQSVRLDTFPWLGFLGYKNRRGPGVQWLCGGSLITSKHILTAAHCIHGYEKDLFIVRFFKVKSGRDSGVVDLSIKAKIKHEQFNPSDYTNDIGILVLENKVTFTASIMPICIPKDSELRARSFESYHPFVAAWDDHENAVGVLPLHLRVNEVPVLSNDVCKKAYSQYVPKIDERVLCAGYKSGERDACEGDSGGPLMQPIANQQNFAGYYQTGIISFVKNCAERGFPGIYTRVTHYVPWIEEIIGSS